ncbi:cation:proton antiporter [Kinneretia asaccharophila]|uniref:Kef-type potassium/proton antiporter (CPA2 family) n=1 Tax=Roseateles asaccharophilus TaxID=582607 RepID=A0A4R6N7H4_9BURK|nr:cation:proton antiporter [Roseateles asaccharophilus]MDN3545294.1 cation:proton antiporter [Roseateles asaccharophilus]TDP11319.1 Kef-type potassium/proton antiporter (CPA2 family) [Roseateles asaccharophilus]
MKAEASVLVYILIYLAAMVLVVPLARRFGLGAVLGYLLAGVLIGPYGLQLADGSPGVALLAELGVVLMLFTIGLELDLKKLWSMRAQVLGLGLLQMLVTGCVLGLAVLSWGLPQLPALLIGLTLALSSTAVAVQLMNDRRIMGTPVGKSAFGILLFQDMAAIPLLIATSVLFPSSGAPTFKAWPALAAVAGLILAGRYLIGHGLRWIAANGSRELFVAAALLLVILVMELMISVGVSAGLGAFIAGVMLASSEYRHELEADLEPFKGLFLGLFFITIGAGINLGLLAQLPFTILALLLAFMAVKFLTLYLQAWLAGMSVRERLSFATLLGQGGEFGFVVIGAALAGAMLSAEHAGLLNLVIALSMAASPLLMKFNDLVAARYLSQAETAPTHSEPMEHSPVIIAGFGRYGQIVARLLMSNGMSATVLDHGAQHIANMQQFGFKIHYGDAARLDLLEAAGAHHAQVLVVAVDERETALKIVSLAKKHFPHLRLVARALDVPHAYELMRMGADVIERELFESSLLAGRRVLEFLGFDAHEARELADRFRATNKAQLQASAQLSTTLDRKEFISLLRRGREELEHQLTQEARMPRIVKSWRQTTDRPDS